MIYLLQKVSLKEKISPGAENEAANSVLQKIKLPQLMFGANVVNLEQLLRETNQFN